MQQTHLSLVILLWTILPTMCQLLSDDQCRSYTSECKEIKGCFHINDETVICCSIASFQTKELFGTLSKNRGIKHVHLFNITLPELILHHSYDSFESLSITNGNITQVTIKGDLNNLTCMNLTDNKMFTFNQIGKLPKLKVLDLSHNNLTKLPADLDAEVQNLTLDISGNIQMLCTNIRQFVRTRKKVQSVSFRNKNDTKCSLNSNFMWFNTTDYISFGQIENVAEPETQCQQQEGLENCRCRWVRVLFPGPVVTLDIDCSNLQLKSLPSRLPPNTIILNVSNNNITSLDPMKEISYSKVRYFHADNNHISSITVLEGTSFISNFSMLSIRSNNLTSIPTYFLSNSFDRNYASSRVQLGGNKLACDCNTAQVLKGWLMSNKKFVLDYDDLECRNYPKRVMELEQQDVCVTQRSWTDYIYYIIAGEVALFVLLFSKVTYDYWVFKTAGYLPWPASKMPKLPCDMFFET